MENKIKVYKTETSPAIAVALLEDEKNSKRPIVFGHGAAMGSWDFEEYFMPYFFEKGYNVYALNWRGYGESELAEGQDYHAVTLGDCVQDLRNVVEFVKERTGKDPIIAGHSQGGAVTEMYMKEYETETAILIGMADFAYLMPPVIEFFVTRFPEGKKRVDAGDMGWFSDDRAFQYAFMFGDETNPKMEKWADMMATQGAAAATVNDVMTIYKVGGAIGNPKVFIVSGSEDPAAIPESIESGIKAYNAENLVIEGMYHGVPNSKDWQKAADGIINWLEK
ncbi:MAG: alpha/beta hydrolase [Planctomycetes bacterium]|nr:alpha/beta hydrolase [Planctomycetota bacterium]